MPQWRTSRETFSRVWRSAVSAFRPPEKITLSEWAERYAYLSPEFTAEPGKWHSIPYQVGIMDAFTDPDVEKITVMKSARIGYTRIIGHAIGYHIHHDPASILVVQPTLDDAKDYSKEDIAPMIRDTPVLSQLVSDPKSRDSSNTIRKKLYPGGTLTIIGAHSPLGFRRITVRVVLFDEVDGYKGEAGKEGDQIKLGTKRTETYWNRKIFLGSTPGVKGLSRIESHYERSDKRRYYVPCPHCKFKHPLEFPNLRWPKGCPEAACFVCPKCDEDIDESYKMWMLKNGEWIAENDEVKGHAGFHIWTAYSVNANATWGDIATEFLAAKNNRDELKTFVNTVLGETWEEQGNTVDDDVYYMRREVYGPELPEGAVLVTVGVDVQDDRLECETVAWGAGEESWGMRYDVFHGDPGRPELWARLDDVLSREWLSVNGLTYNVAAMGIDSGGHFTDAVYRYVAKHSGRGVFALKGRGGAGIPYVNRGSKGNNRYGVKVFTVGVDGAKDDLYFSRLRVDLKPGESGYCHFPVTYDQEYFHQLAGEHKVDGKWVLKSRSRRVEALDCRIYATAVLRLLNPDLDRIAGHRQNNVVKPVTPDTGSRESARKRNRGGGWFDSCR